MTLQDKKRFKKMYMFAKDASTIAGEITIERLTADKAYQYSLLYPLGQIGELAINMGDGIHKLFPEIEWSDWRGFRNRLFHDYGTIDFSIVLEMIAEALPLLMKELEKIENIYTSN